MERFTGKLKRLGEVEFAQRRAPDRTLHTVAIGVGEDGIVGRDGLLYRMDRGVPSVARRLDRRIRLDGDFDELRFRKQSVRGASVRGGKSNRRDRKYENTADLCRRHPNSPVLATPANTSPAQKGSTAVSRIGYISRAGSAIDCQLNRFEWTTESTFGSQNAIVEKPGGAGARGQLPATLAFAASACIDRMYMTTCQRCSGGISSA